MVPDSTVAYCLTPDLMRITGLAYVLADKDTQRAGPRKKSLAS